MRAGPTRAAIVGPRDASQVVPPSTPDVSSGPVPIPRSRPGTGPSDRTLFHMMAPRWPSRGRNRVCVGRASPALGIATARSARFVPRVRMLALRVRTLDRLHCHSHARISPFVWHDWRAPGRISPFVWHECRAPGRISPFVWHDWRAPGRISAFVRHDWHASGRISPFVRHECRAVHLFRWRHRRAPSTSPCCVASTWAEGIPWR